jgi:hypothetical protein
MDAIEAEASTPVSSSTKSVKMYDMDGRLKHSQTIEASKDASEIDMSGLENGIYILQISDGEKMEVHRIVKE